MADTPALRTMARAGLVTIEQANALCAENDHLRSELESVRKGLDEQAETIEHLRAQKFHARRIMAALLDPCRYVIEVDRETAAKSGQVGAVK